MSTMTPKIRIPLLAAGQAQKEITHNEALAIIDALIVPVVQSVAPSNVPSSPLAGQSWIVGTSPTGDWLGQANALATWSQGGWRFTLPINGFVVSSLADGMQFQFDGAAWVKGQINAANYNVNGTRVVSARQPAISSPSGGSVVDAEVRIIVTAILAAMQTHGLIAT